MARHAVKGKPVSRVQKNRNIFFVVRKTEENKSTVYLLQELQYFLRIIFINTFLIVKRTQYNFIKF